ncbi:MAG TPA: M23 family metallopeptidase [Kofleriaceae bacterium]|nr:M23 family metallopeptidase [Kofleriaceae bacterium]
MPLLEGRPFVTASGAVELWHASCWAVRDARPVEEVTVVMPPRARRDLRRVAMIGGAAVVALVAAGQWARAEMRPHVIAPPETTEVMLDGETVRVHAEITSREDLPPSPDPTANYPLPDDDYGVPLDEQYPSLREWAHPVTDTHELMPPQAARHFGAERVGIERPECGLGHCGVDLDGPRGQPIVAVADGIVVRVEHSELGLDGRSGRYVRIQHEDGTLTAYMHLDDIADGLEVGDRVEAGQFIGTLGATATYSAPPHLHFSLEIPNHADLHGDITDTHYVDPAPFLVRATVLAAPDRRHAMKPAM